MSLNQLRDKRGQIVADARAILHKVEAEKRAMNQEEETHYDSLIDEQSKLKNTIEREVQLKELEREAIKADLQRSKGKPTDDNITPEMSFYRDFLLNRTPQNALQTDSNTGGGYLVPPQQVVQDLLKKTDDLVFIRQFATKFQVENVDSLGVPSLENDPDDFDWTTELQSGTDDASMSFGKRELRPHPMAKRIKVSKTLLRKVPNVEAVVNDRLAYKLAITQEKAYLLGNGNQRPLGLFIASNNGIPTSRDFSTGNTTTAIGMDVILEAFYGVKTQYQRSGSWLFHRDAVKQVAKLKDTTNQYLWQPGIKDGDPDTLKGRPVFQSKYVPNTFTTGQYVGLFGDLSYYYIADGLNPTMQRLQELYAESNQDGFIIRQEGDGMPVLGEAFARMKLA